MIEPRAIAYLFAQVISASRASDRQRPVFDRHRGKIHRVHHHDSTNPAEKKRRQNDKK